MKNSDRIYQSRRATQPKAEKSRKFGAVSITIGIILFFEVLSIKVLFLLSCLSLLVLFLVTIIQFVHSWGYFFLRDHPLIEKAIICFKRQNTRIRTEVRETIKSRENGRRVALIRSVATITTMYRQPSKKKKIMDREKESLSITSTALSSFA